MAKAAKKKPSLEEFQQEIRVRAEEIYQNRMSANKAGDALSDWLQAEKDIRKKYGL